MHLGSSPSHKDYKCLTSTGHIIISRHVKLDENCFPYACGFGGSHALSPQPRPSLNIVTLFNHLYVSTNLSSPSCPNHNSIPSPSILHIIQLNLQLHHILSTPPSQTPDLVTSNGLTTLYIKFPLSITISFASNPPQSATFNPPIP